MNSGKDPGFKRFSDPCSQCEKGSSFEKGVRLAGAARNRRKAVHDINGLYKLYESFEGERVRKFKKMFGNDDIGFDPFCKFVVEKTDICPHRIISPLSNYWIETFYTIDGEMSLTLPYRMDELPGVFFDALGAFRNGKSIAHKEDAEKK